MARGSQQAQTGATQSLNNSSTFGGNAGSLYSTVAPALAADIAHPAGMNPVDLARLRTENEQSAGGSEAAAVGQGALLAGRTKNAGSADAAVDAAARGAGQQLSSADLKTNLANEDLKQQQRSQALGEEGGLYGTSVGGSNSALGENANNVNANTNAANESWDWAKYILGPTLSGSASAYAGR